MRLFLQFFALSDRYERKARLLPGLLLAVGPALTAGAILQEVAQWYTAAGAAVGLEFLAAIVFGHYARARGRAIEEPLWATWGGPPTTRWLRPTDSTCSDQQKSKWRGAIRRLTGMTIPASIPEGADATSIDQSIQEATRQLRYAVRGKPHAAIVQSHNEDYGFARNLLGVRWLWVMLSVLCVAASGVAMLYGMKPHAAFAISLTVLTASLLIAFELPNYVRRCADRYAESLFAAAMLPDPPAVTDGGKPKSESTDRQ
ncbi:hypothetical protein SH661x_001830 [Planctomicrobium sp. SH661]|uniref:hypothetical protein n=1 Tax=Planctomicrobium sp. SH661 TaxID=3448124 RepID=UPI003F5AF703